jgi:membrane protease YdiL (CAAX protease family)
MYVESALWTIPLLFLILLIDLMLGHPGASAPPVAAAGDLVGPALQSRPWPPRATIALGAGLYEELVFRMIGMAALHLVLVDLFRLKEGTGRLAAVLISAAAFALYHDPSWSGGTVSLKAVPYFVAGCYFGMIYLQRGFGIAVGVHALYDILVLVILPALGRQ